MESLVIALRITFGVLFCFAGILHLIKPKIFKNFIPNFLPKLIVNYVFGMLEFLLGLTMFLNSLVNYGALGIFILMVIFLPIHIWDATKIRPAIGSKKVAYVRIPLQFLLMYIAYLIYQFSLE